MTHPITPHPITNHTSHTRSVILCLDDPSLDPDSHLRKALNVLDIFFTAAFGIEAVLKIVMTGLVVNGHGSYLRSPWNCLDAFVVLIGER